MGTCTIIGCHKIGTNYPDVVLMCQPIKDALHTADTLHASGMFTSVRVYAETNGGTTLTLIYQPI